IRGVAFRVSRADLWATFQGYHYAIGEKLSLDRAGLFDRIRRIENVTDDMKRDKVKVVRGFKGIGVRTSKPPATKVNDDF
ncbi:MAG: hypothetical protein SGI86_11955, partial [Deltaproteobacteria bacterium]|nr:hypothetical protein [Deltaproteobacteria bacterium]